MPGWRLKIDSGLEGDAGVAESVKGFALAVAITLSLHAWPLSLLSLDPDSLDLAAVFSASIMNVKPSGPISAASCSGFRRRAVSDGGRYEWPGGL